MPTDTPPRDWGLTLALPKTEFPMRAGLPQMEPKLLERWRRIGLYEQLRQGSKGRGALTGALPLRKGARE